MTPWFKKRSAICTAAGNDPPGLPRKSSTRTRNPSDRKRNNALSVSGWRPLFEQAADRADSVQRDLRGTIETELQHLESAWPRTASNSSRPCPRACRRPSGLRSIGVT